MSTKQMVGIEFLEKLKELGMLNEALRKGWVSLSLNNYKHMKEFYDIELKTLKSKKNKRYKMQALQNTCEKFSCQKDTVYQALKMMET